MRVGHWRRKVLLLGAVALLGVLAACAGDDETPTPTVPAGSTPTATSPAGVATPTATTVSDVVPTGDKYGGTLRFAKHSTPTRYEPQQGGIGSMYPMKPIYERLITADVSNSTTLSYVPNLAESWETQDGGKTIIFTLRQGVTWHDGTPFTQADVVASLNRLLETGAFKSAFGPTFDSITTPDANTVTFSLTAPLGKLLAEFGIAGARIAKAEMIADLNAGEQVGPDDTVGTGPMKYVSWSTAGGFVGERNVDYYGTDPDGNQLPYLDGYVGFPIVDEGTRLASYLGGQLDLLQPIAASTQMATTIRRQAPDHTVIAFSPNDYYFFFANVAPFTDYNVRKAFHLAFDRHANAAITHKEWGNVWSVTPPYLGGLDEAELWQMPGFRVDIAEDVAEANRLLDAAGLTAGSDGVRMKITVASPLFQEYLDNAILYASDLKTIGIDFKMTPWVDPGDRSSRKAGCDFQTFNDRSAVLPDPDSDLEDVIRDPFDTSSDPLTTCGWPEVQALTDMYLTQSATFDPVERALLIKEYERAWYANEEVGLVWLPEHMGSYLGAHWPYVRGGKMEEGERWFHYQAHMDWTTVWLDK